MMSNLNRMLAGSMIAWCGGLSAEQAIAQVVSEPVAGGTASLTDTEPESSRLRLDPSSWSIDLGPSYSPGALQETPPFPESTSEWRFIAQSHWWLPLRIKGDVTSGTTSTNLDITLSDIFDDLKMVVEGGFELSKDEWSFLVWGVYFNIATDVDTDVSGVGNFDTAIDFKATIVDMAGAYRVADWPMGDSETATWGLDLLAGIMVWDVEVDIHERGPLGFDPMVVEDDNWVDPIIGGRFVFNFSEELNASLRGEVGGFDIGSGSTLTWNITVMAEYKLASNVGLALGFRYLDLDWSKGSGDSKLEYDLAIYGPIIGVSIHF
jgi:hypothetical protein